MLFQNTRNAITSTINDIRSAVRTTNILTQLLYIGYLIYALCTSAGILPINIALLSISVIYFVFYACTYNPKTRTLKRFKSNTRHAYKWIKLSLNAVMLSNTIYGIYIAASLINPVTIILATLSVIAWILQIALEFVTLFFEHHLNMLVDAFVADKDEFTRPIKAAGDFIRQVSTPGSAVSTIKSFIGSKFGRNQNKSQDNDYEDKTAEEPVTK